eukprot:Nk52_evm58s239 gene=Nk52_evmTU58s239
MEAVPLYVAKSLSDLRKATEVNYDENHDVKKYLNSAELILKKGQDYYKLKDEEQAYILYMKFANLLEAIRNSKKPKTDPGVKEKMRKLDGLVLGVIERLEKLTVSLKERYASRVEGGGDVAKPKSRPPVSPKPAVRKPISSPRVNSAGRPAVGLDPPIPSSSPVPRNNPVTPSSTGGTGVDKNPKSAVDIFNSNGASPVPPPRPSGNRSEIGPPGLYTILKSGERRNVLLIDVRSKGEYAKSHIKCDHIINMPPEMIAGDCARIEMGLDAQYKGAFSRRNNFKHVVIIDRSGEECLTNKSHSVYRLKQALEDCLSQPLQSEAKVLKGGHDTFTLLYPTYCMGGTGSVERSKPVETSNVSYPILPNDRFTSLVSSPSTVPTPQKRTTSYIELFENMKIPSYEETHSPKPPTTGAPEKVLPQRPPKPDFAKPDYSSVPSSVTSRPAVPPALPPKTNMPAYSNVPLVPSKALPSKPLPPKPAEFVPPPSTTPVNRNTITSDDFSARTRRSSNPASIVRRVSQDDMGGIPSPPDRTRKPELLAKKRSVVLRQANFDPVFGDTKVGLTGLKNLGNTCYMSSIIQCLSNTTVFAVYFADGSYIHEVNEANPLGTKGEVAGDFGELIRALWKGRYKSISPRDFKGTVGRFAKQFQGTNQHDSQEFLAYLMDVLHEDLNRIAKKIYVEEDYDNMPELKAAKLSWENHRKRNDSIVIDLFQGQFKSTICCLKCGNTSVTFSPFMYLSVPLPPGNKVSVQDCISLFTRPEKVSGQNEWYCNKCKCHREAKMQLEIWRLPPILMIHLKRFQFEGRWRKKLDTVVNFPLHNLDMNPHIRGPYTVPKYNLYGVSNHYGTMEGGHYTAYCKNVFEGSWSQFDDTVVSSISESKICSKASYVLFYTAIDFKSSSQKFFQ